ncbi:hypothetical protein WJX79_002609 [Trebouxia sp. C0005]
MAASGEQDLYDNPDAKIRYEAYRCEFMRYEAYSRLQAAAVAHGESLPIPEIVAIGGQSDGKSSLLEAFLGFRFNIREVEMGTRRPLICQMVHDPTAQQPRCRIQDEDSDEYGPPIMPETAVAEEIKLRTEKHLQQNGGTVSAKPIVMRAEYAYSPNLTIVDTPGFILKARKGEADTTPDDILSMVKAQAHPPHRLILFLQQSSVEWCSSLWMHVIQEVDPNFQRTVVVASKFDNRLKEFAERWEVDRYLSATGYLHPNAKPFFVALPKDRSLTASSEWRQAIQQVDSAVLSHLRTEVAGGFDEEQFGSRIGFANLKMWLEEELARRYRDAAPATLALLQERCEGVAAELVAAESRLQAAEDVTSLRRAAMQHVFAMANHVTALLNGATDPDPSQHGMTTEEERASSSKPQWPAVHGPVRPQNASLRLYGGAAFERCLDEFQEAAHVVQFPTVARDKVANVLLASKGRGAAGGPAHTAQDLARSIARELLSPLLDTACCRLASLLRHAFDIAADSQQLLQDPSHDTLRPYVAFHAALRSAYHSFIAHLEDNCKSLMRHHLEAATSEFAVTTLAGMDDLHVDDRNDTGVTSTSSDDFENANRESMHPRESVIDREPLRESQMTVPETPSPDMLAAGKGGGRRRDFLSGRNADNPSPTKARGRPQRNATAANMSNDQVKNSYGTICGTAEKMFNRIRQGVTCHAAPSSLKSAFLEPLSSKLASQISIDLLACTDEEFMAMFTAAGAVAVLEARRDALARRVEGLVRCKNEFQELARCL